MSSPVVQVHLSSLQSSILLYLLLSFTRKEVQSFYVHLMIRKAHSECSEGFYKKQIESDIRAEPSKTASERTKMLELLKRFEEDSLDDPFDDDPMTELVKKFHDVDLDEMDADAIWALLSADERTKFIAAMRDPSSELVQNLLASEQFEKDRRLPWWQDQNSEGQRGTLPKILTIPIEMRKVYPHSHSLLYNLCAICIAYAYTTRSLAVSPLGSLDPENPDRKEARRLITQLVPFLTDNKSTILYNSLSAATVDVWSKFDNGQVSPEIFSVLLRDTASLLRPSPVTVVCPDHELDSHPLNTILRVLSDLHRLFVEKSRRTHVTQKIMFYAARILATPSAVLGLLAEEAVSQSRRDMSKEQVDESSRVPDSVTKSNLIQEL